MATARDSNENSKLEACFKQIIEGNKVELDICTLNAILGKSLGINFNLLKPKMKFILPYMLVHFIKGWPGWKKTSHYYNKQMTIEIWFQKFKEYLIFKINFMIKNDFEKAVAMLRYNSTELDSDKVVNKTDSGTQTTLNIEKVMAPFSIEVAGPPKILNSLVFCEGKQDAVYVKEYKVTTQWETALNVRQLVNWPCIEVEFQSEHLHFKRTNKHDFRRCLTFSTEKIFFKRSDHFIEEINIIDENVSRQAYTLNTVKEYCNAYITLLRNQENSSEWSSSSLNEAEIVLEDLILDIVDINMNSIATNTSILYNIGNSIYARNKSIKTSEHAICFGECITPKLFLSMYSFTAVKDANITSFDDLFSNKNHLLPTIIFRCTYCKVAYQKSSELWQHLQNYHTMEQPVLCFKCKLQFKISNLTDNRWFHQCGQADVVVSNSTAAPSS